MAIVRCVTVWQSLTGLPRDEVENSLVFDDPTAISAAALASTVEPAMTAFWSVAGPGGVQPIGGYLSNNLDHTPNSARFDFYRLSDGPSHTVTLPEGPPVVTVHFTMPPPGAGAAGGDLPGEVALCMSFHGSEVGLSLAVGGVGKTHKGGTRPASRVRGRIFVGPFNSLAFPIGSNEAPNQLMRDLAAAGAGLRTAAPSWAVWSRKNGTTESVNGGFVDNEWDSVRRRQVRATTRTAF